MCFKPHCPLKMAIDQGSIPSTFHVSLARDHLDSLHPGGVRQTADVQKAVLVLLTSTLARFHHGAPGDPHQVIQRKNMGVQYKVMVYWVWGKPPYLQHGANGIRKKHGMMGLNHPTMGIQLVATSKMLWVYPHWKLLIQQAQKKTRKSEKSPSGFMTKLSILN